jgi:hypothetical protein
MVSLVNYRSFNNSCYPNWVGNCPILHLNQLFGAEKMQNPAFHELRLSEQRVNSQKGAFMDGDRLIPHPLG